MLDEIAKRRFHRIAGQIGKAQNRLESHIRGLHGEAGTLSRLLEDYLEGLERITGVTPETARIRHEIETALAVFADPRVVPAIDAVQQHLDIAATELAQLVGALPKSP